MSTIVTSRASPRIGRPSSRTDSPMDPKKAVWKDEDSENTSNENKQSNDASSRGGGAAQQSGSDTPDYFSGVHGTSHLNLEPNPFEQSFGNPPPDTPGKSLLPPVASITSPALPGPNSAGGFNWSNSLRSGPLSPAMLQGPTSANDYFDSIRQGYPTPNESSLRTGLTPNGSGSMFPAPSPNSALLQHLQSGTATPSTLEFHRTALDVVRKNGGMAPTSNPQGPDQLLQPPARLDVTKAEPPVDPFAQHAATDAANGLFLLSKGRQPNENPFALAASQQVNAQVNAANRDPNVASNQSVNGTNIQTVQNGNAPRAEAAQSMSPTSDTQAKTSAKGKGKKAMNGKAATAANGRRKAEDTTNKGSNKRAKGNAGTVVDMEEPDTDDDDDTDDTKSVQTASGSKSKMTEEEKRKNFLERNRVAALKCRQRKKQWLQNLQQKVEFFSNENEALSNTVTQLREEVVSLKQILLAHKDCPVSQSQGLIVSGMVAEFPQHQNPYGMSMQPPVQGIPTQAMARR
ncbi:hypothetical protein AJ80_04338 [Polytolypa hystricis UAMH7299]|uniref:BZIP domain-containing protein n=1 Tax=Polytolypa hystricis (strain UAMH7299) TaxID=1447883 RepID=A0A2B7YDD5_POLH7|nr:hypothetical protein AJ80_04338 [Polytolypa hystricis UAMH7299]